MFELVPFKREHVTEMLKQDINQPARDFFTTVNYDILESLISFTGLVNGKPVVCGGIVPYWTGRGSLWTIFDENAKNCFVPVFRGIKAFLDRMKPMYNRLEIAVPCNFELGIRRAKLLGFDLECERAKKFLPDGQDCSLFVLLGGS